VKKWICDGKLKAIKTLLGQYSVSKIEIKRMFDRPSPESATMLCMSMLDLKALFLPYMLRSLDPLLL